MAVIDPATQQPKNIPLQLVTNTIPDPVRKWTGVGLMITGIAILSLAVIISMFPTIGANSAPGLQWGPIIFAAGSATLWDRQTPTL